MIDISVIVPVYNVEKYLPKCLDSIINQTLRTIEIICVNDGSTDNSGNILNHYAAIDSRIKVLSQSNRGLSAARNTGLSAARGAFIQFCDSDDYYDIAMCETMLKAVTDNDIDIAVSDVQVDYDGVPRQPDTEYYCRIKQDGLYTISDKTFTATNVYVWNKIYRKAIIDLYYIRFPEGLLYEDAAFFFKYIYVANRIYYINKKLYHYLRRRGTITSQSGNTIENRMKVHHLCIVEDIAQFITCNKLQEKHTAAFTWLICMYTRYANLHEQGGRIIFDNAYRLIHSIDKTLMNKKSLNFYNQLYFYSINNNSYASYYLLNLLQAAYNKMLTFTHPQP
jgi:glycosyltransferase involved in cell wall biosynthesis